MFGWFSQKKEVDRVKTGMKSGFDSVKKDISSIGEWIKHLDSEKVSQQDEISDIKEVLSSIKDELENVKNIVSVIGEVRSAPKSNRVFKQQTGVYPVQTAVQTGVQTPNFDQFSMTERALLWVLLNTDLKLAYDDLAAILGKEKTTIRGQINTIRQKQQGIIEEIIEPNGKKRVYIPEYIKEKLLKKAKVRVKKGQKAVKNQKSTLKVNIKT